MSYQTWESLAAISSHVRRVATLMYFVCEPSTEAEIINNAKTGRYDGRMLTRLCAPTVEERGYFLYCLYDSDN